MPRVPTGIRWQQPRRSGTVRPGAAPAGQPPPCPGTPAGALPPAPPRAPRRGCLHPEPDLSGPVHRGRTRGHRRARELAPSVHADPVASRGPSLRATQGQPGTRGSQPGPPGPGLADLTLSASGGHPGPGSPTRPCLPHHPGSTGPREGSPGLCLCRAHCPSLGSRSLPAAARRLTPRPAPSGTPSLGRDGRLHGLSSPASHDLICPRSSQSLPDKSQALLSPGLQARSPPPPPAMATWDSRPAQPAAPLVSHPRCSEVPLAPTPGGLGSPSFPTPAPILPWAFGSEAAGPRYLGKCCPGAQGRGSRSPDPCPEI